MKNILRYIIAALMLVGFILALNGCASNLGNVRSAEAHQTAAMNKVRKDVATKDADEKKVKKADDAISTQEANLNRDLRYAVALQQTPETKAAEVTLLDLQYQLTGPASTTQDEQQDVVQKLMGTVVEKTRENEQLTQENSNLQTGKASAESQVAKDKIKIGEDATALAAKTAQLYSVAEFSAIKADEWSHFTNNAWTALYIAVGVLVLCFAFWLFERYGKKAAITAAEVAGAVVKTP